VTGAALLERLDEMWGTYHRLHRELDKWRHATDDDGIAAFDAGRDALIAHVAVMRQEGLRP
jgi:hypothetical protein